MIRINLIFPHQLFENSPLFEKGSIFYIVEEYLFFRQFNFHKQKLAFHRATMRNYANYLKEHLSSEVHYIDTTKDISDIRLLLPELRKKGVEHINYIDPTDNWLQKRLEVGFKEAQLASTKYDSPLFINTPNELTSFFKVEKKKYHQTTFYTDQRKKRNILLDNNGGPTGGKWTFDSENRKKYPSKKHLR